MCVCVEKGLWEMKEDESLWRVCGVVGPHFSWPCVVQGAVQTHTVGERIPALKSFVSNLRPDRTRDATHSWEGRGHRSHIVWLRRCGVYKTGWFRLQSHLKDFISHYKY